MTAQIITRINQMLSEWKAGQPLSQDAEQKLDSKQNLLWSYNSNHLEGNTLTYGETELLLIHGKTKGMHPVRDVDEMRAHHVAVGLIRNWARESRKISESDIRDLNRILLKEPFSKQTITPEGLPTQKKIIPGEYKSSSNHVRTITGEIFRFAEPFEVPMKMADFVQNLRKKLPSEAGDLAGRLAELHHEFILIHPFDDGNGRTVRLLLNYILLRDKYPAIVIKASEKREYLNALQLADTGNINRLADFLLLCLQDALELGVKAIKGESLEEPEDVDMKVELLKRRVFSEGKMESATPQEKKDFCRFYILPYAKAFEGKFSQLNSLFLEHGIDFEMYPVNGRIVTCETYLEFAKLIEHCPFENSKFDIYLRYSGTGFIDKTNPSFEVKTLSHFSLNPTNVRTSDGTNLPYNSVLTENEAIKLLSQKLEKEIKGISF